MKLSKRYWFWVLIVVLLIILVPVGVFLYMYANYSYSCMDGWSATYYAKGNAMINISSDYRLAYYAGDKLSQFEMDYLIENLTAELNVSDERPIYVKAAEILLERNNISKVMSLNEFIDVFGRNLDTPSLPQPISNEVIASSSKGCAGFTDYYIIKEGELDKVFLWNFKSYIKKYNQSCNGCLITFSNGCC